MNLKGFILKYKKSLIFLTIFFILPTIINGSVIKFHPRVKVGLVMVDDLNMTYAVSVKEGFDHHDEYFTAKIIGDYRLNSSNIRVNNLYLLNGDFHNDTLSRELRRKYDVDAILYITDKLILNWDDPYPKGYWGQASLETSSAVMTVHYHMNNTPYDTRRRQATGVHEIGHLVGLVHPPRPQTADDIMIYADRNASIEFNSYYEATLPFHLMVYKLGHGYHFGRGGVGHNMLLIKALADLFFLPYIIGTAILLLHIFNFLNKLERIHRSAVAIIAIFGYIFYTTTVFYFEAIPFIVVFMALIAILYHAGMNIQITINKRNKGAKDGSGIGKAGLESDGDGSGP